MPRLRSLGHEQGLAVWHRFRRSGTFFGHLVAIVVNALQKVATDQLEGRLSTRRKPPGYAELVAARGDEESRIEASRMIIEAAERLSREIDEALDRLLLD